MDDRDRAEAWVRDRLDEARAAFRRRPPGPRDLTLEEYEARLRRMTSTWLRPVDQYAGLSVDQAQALAETTSDALCIHRGERGHRLDWRADRVHVVVRADGTIAAAHRDPPPWPVEGQVLRTSQVPSGS
jgi:hypothetical protein